MKKILPMIFTGIGILFCFPSCQRARTEPYIKIISANSVEAEGILPLSVYMSLPSESAAFDLMWETTGGVIRKTRVENEVDFLASGATGNVKVRVSAGAGEDRISAEKEIRVLEGGALNSTVKIRMEVDTNTLTAVYVDGNAPSESFTPPLTIKGTFNYNESSGSASAGGNWTNYLLYDDGTHGDLVEDDGIWSLVMEFEKSEEKVNFAFDEGSDYRVQWESGLAWRLKTAWIGLDDFPSDKDNPAFVPDRDKVLRWDETMAEKAGIYGGQE